MARTSGYFPLLSISLSAWTPRRLQSFPPAPYNHPRAKINEAEEMIAKFLDELVRHVTRRRRAILGFAQESMQFASPFPFNSSVPGKEGDVGMGSSAIARKGASGAALGGLLVAAGLGLLFL